MSSATTPPTGGNSFTRQDLATAFAVGLAGGLFLLSSLLGGPSNRVVGDWQAPDTLSWQWVADWAGQRLTNFGGIWHASASYAPIGETPLATFDGVGVVLAAPLAAALGWPLGANAYALLCIAANTAAGAWLARTVGAGRFASLFGGVAFAFSPFFVEELSAGRLGQASSWALAAALAAGLGQIHTPSARGRWLTALFLAIATLDYAWYGLMAALALTVVAAVRAVSERINAMVWYREMTVTAALSTLALFPGLFLAQAGMDTAAPDRVPQPLTIEYSLPPLWPAGVDGGPGVPAAVSFVLLGLALLALYYSRGISRSLLAVGVFGWAMSLGPRLLTPGGPIVDSHFPFFLYSTLFPDFNYPYQHVVLVTASLAALAAQGVGVLVRWVGVGDGARVELVLCAALAILTPMELATRGAPLRVRVSHLAPVPEWVDDLRELPEGAMLTLPLTAELRVSQENLVLQRLHKHPTIDGRSAWRDDQRPRAWDEMVEASGFLKELQRFERGREIKGDPERANYFRYPVEDLERLEQHGLRWIIVWDSLYADSIKGLARNERQLFERLFGKPVIATRGVSVFDVRGHREDGDIVAPPWRFPEGARPGDGVRRMASIVPPGVFFERGPPAPR